MTDLKISPSKLALRDDYIFTYSGGIVTPLSPRAKDIKVEDVAHSLANQCRFTGHTKKFYSVAQHVVTVSLTLRRWGHSPSVQFQGLHHDDSEAYLADLARPIKVQAGFGAAYRKAEKRLEKTAADAFGIQYPYDPAVYRADVAVFHAEARDLMPEGFVAGASVREEADPIEQIVEAWGPEKAERMYLQLHDELTNAERGFEKAQRHG